VRCRKRKGTRRDEDVRTFIVPLKQPIEFLDLFLWHAKAEEGLEEGIVVVMREIVG
jgi:hypothetical protein